MAELGALNTMEQWARLERHRDEKSISLLLSAILKYKYNGRPSRLVTIRLLEVIYNEISVSCLGWKYIPSGSSSEGQMEAISDFDHLWVDTSMDVLFEQSDGAYKDSPTLYKSLQGRDSHNSGYYYLSAEHASLFRRYELCRDEEDKNLISSSKFIEGMFAHLESVSNVELCQGPSVQRGPLSPIHMQTDNVFALFCPKWPDSVKMCLKQRKWLSDEEVEQLAEAGCHVVPIGKQESSTKSLEWRLSFSIAEKELMTSFLNLTQFCSYNMMKCIVSEIRKRSVIVHAALCTYHAKTLLFCAIAETKISWSEDNLLNCIYSILTKMSSCFRSRTLPNFFVPENNMIEHLPITSCLVVADEIDKLSLDELAGKLFKWLWEPGKLWLPEYKAIAQFTTCPPVAEECCDTMLSEQIAAGLCSKSAEELLVAVRAAFNEEYCLSDHKRRMSIRNDLQNILDPVFYDTLPDTNYSFSNIEEALLVAINVSSKMFDADTANCFVQVLYRACGNINSQAAVLPELSDCERQNWIQKAEQHYIQGKGLVYPDKFDDDGFSGTVHLMQFYYLNERYPAVAGQTAHIVQYLDYTSFDEVIDISRYAVLSELCNPIHLQNLGKADPELYKYFSGLKVGDSKFVNSMALGHYLRIRANQRQHTAHQDLLTMKDSFEKFCCDFLQLMDDRRIDVVARESCVTLRDIVRQSFSA